MAKVSDINGYDLSRAFFDWSYENPELISPNHVALYFFIIEHRNRLGWKVKLGLPARMTMDAIGIKNWKTYKRAFDDLVKWGFIKVLEVSKNQYSATVIALVKNTKAHTKALSKASQKHAQKQVQSIVDIDKLENLRTIEQMEALENASLDDQEKIEEVEIVLPDEPASIENLLAPEVNCTSSEDLAGNEDPSAPGYESEPSPEETENPPTEKDFYNACVKIWFDHHPDWVFSDKDGKGIKEIIKKLKDWQKSGAKEVTPETTSAAFNFILSHKSVKENNFLSVADPTTLNGKLNSVYETIKNYSNVKKQSTFSTGNGSRGYDPTKSIFAD